MTKSTKIALVILLAGALVAGVGSGVALVEFSSLRYEAMEVDGNAPAPTAEETIEIPAEGSIAIVVPSRECCTIKEDEAVALGTISISACASSLADAVDINGPYADGRFYSSGSSGMDGGSVPNVAVSVYPIVRGGVDWMLLHKDEILQGLKEGVLYGLPSPYDGFAVEVRANPSDIDRVLVS